MDKGEMERLAKDPQMQKRRQAITDPTRMRIIGLVSESGGLTAKELAERMRMDPNRLYYHLRILEEVGVIETSELRATGRMTERVYTDAYSGRYIWDIDDPGELATYLSSQLELTKMEGEESLFEQSRRISEGEEPPLMTWGRPTVTTTHKEIQEFTKRLNDLLAEFRERAQAIREKEKVPDPTRMRFTWVVCEQAVPQPTSTESLTA